MPLTALDLHRTRAVIWCASLVELEVCVAGNIPVHSSGNHAVYNLRYTPISANNPLPALHPTSLPRFFAPVATIEYP
jgi:hypothetical protein